MFLLRSTNKEIFKDNDGCLNLQNSLKTINLLEKIILKIKLFIKNRLILEYLWLLSLTPKINPKSEILKRLKKYLKQMFHYLNN